MKNMDDFNNDIELSTELKAELDKRMIEYQNNSQECQDWNIVCEMIEQRLANK